MTTNDARAREILWDDPAIALIRRDMLRFAQLQLRDAGAAEDMVQEALFAAMSHAESFAGRAALKTWVFGILRHKIVDHLRASSREICGADLVDATGPDGCMEDFDALFDRRGFWNPEDRPATWSDPEASFSQKEFWAVFEACLDHLPAHIARVYMMREFLELDTGEICRQLGITTGNCWVILHRARLGLRACLENRWFHGEAAT
ncbi:sigma-70 family RNA polymerase sigma factor [Aromatoleum toluvorans]|uniref:Sigma-70 family RNA polymerase sigma factor n=1 Tax=Aromatoleum toluvorans TaxID=92002 RepID=A0ABX1Q4V7_9RHOO|nr:sigma-70 family RNA polymerase sigma factor [Aromatoleum toluvorans]NMG45564.1 sigma-70 family RNA polymerase sigma factor [Aromatoleum toluvorans]